MPRHLAAWQVAEGDGQCRARKIYITDLDVRHCHHAFVEASKPVASKDFGV